MRGNGRNRAVQKLRFLQVQVGLDTFCVLRFFFVAGLTVMSESRTVCCLMTGSTM